MKLDIGTIYVVRLTNGRKFSAKLVENDNGLLCFQSRAGNQSQHFIDEIDFVKVVV
jgi:hypothetical protein